jgi:hypothetical protein
LGDPESEWALFLKVDDQLIVPIEIKGIDLSPEYKQFFGKKNSRFKTAYQIKFNAIDDNEQPFVTPQTNAIALVFRSLTKEAQLQWDIKGKILSELHDTSKSDQGAQ